MNEVLPIHEIVFRKGILPILGHEKAQKLRSGLVKNDENLIQSETVLPRPSFFATAKCGCAISYPFIDCKKTSMDIEDMFAVISRGCDALMNEECAISHFLNWFDEGERDKVFPELVEMIDKGVIK